MMRVTKAIALCLTLGLGLATAAPVTAPTVFVAQAGPTTLPD